VPVRIRRARADDAAAIRRLAFDTGFFGASMAELIDDARLFEPALDCYLRPNAAAAFIAETGSDAVGYALASLTDVNLCSAIATIESMAAALLRWPRLTRKDRRFIAARLAFSLRAPFGDERHFRTPSGSRLHINLTPDARSTGTGSALLAHLMADLRDRRITRVHASSYQTARNTTAHFWLKNGFRETSRVRTRVWQAFLPDEVALVCFARDL
jgi:GNAT superfamily N-acetyltransferase